jgi:hypothetical protein
MTSERKQIVIDKCTFQGHRTDVLCAFARNHFLILANLLYGEIVTNPGKRKREHLLRRFRKLMQAGAYWASDVHYMIQQEGQTLQPYGFLPDLTQTLRMRDRFQRGQLFSEEHANHAAESYLRSADVFRKDRMVVSQEFLRNILVQACERRRELKRRPDRLAFLTEGVDQLGMRTLRALATSPFGKSVKVVDRFCLSAEWVTWQYIRLQTVLSLEYALQSEWQKCERECENTEHDLHDLLYVVLLSRTDALLSADKGVCDLARAAFPEKEVFSSLEEVPESYRCD